MRRFTIVITAFATIAAGVAFLIAGLDSGDKLASMIGAVAAIAGLGATVHQSRAPRGAESGPRKYDVRVSRSWFVRIGDGE